jgi:drug/metabolite transporter (DMT)-like permease
MFSKLPKPTVVLIAFACVYLFWGSTYLAIHIADEQLPAPVIVATRCLLSAVFIFAIALAQGKSLRVSKGEVWKLALIGILFMSINNVGLTWAEKMVPSGFASLVISIIPIMIALTEMLIGGEALNARGWIGTVLGTVGISILVWPAIHTELAHGVAAAGFTTPVLAVAILMVAAIAWTIGSILSRRYQFKTDTFVATGWQLSAAGIFNTLLAAGTGSLRHVAWTWRGFGAVVYLAIFGSLFGLAAFTYLLKNVAVTKVSTYAFVNPVIAVLLGVIVLHERLDLAELVGMAVIVCAVAMVIYSKVTRGNNPPMTAVAE